MMCVCVFAEPAKRDQKQLVTHRELSIVLQVLLLLVVSVAAFVLLLLCFPGGLCCLYLSVLVTGLFRYCFRCRLRFSVTILCFPGGLCSL